MVLETSGGVEYSTGLVVRRCGCCEDSTCEVVERCGGGEHSTGVVVETTVQVRAETIRLLQKPVISDV